MNPETPVSSSPSEPTDPSRTPDGTGPSSEPAAQSDSASPVAGAEGYQVADPEPRPVRPAAEPRQPPSTFQPSSAAAEPNRTPEAANTPEQLPEVHEVWTRWVEWKEPIYWIAGTLGLVALIELGGGLTSAAILLAGLAYGLYQIVITLEVPVRVTAEHAVHEFFAALAHRQPSYKRMYLLLTTDAKHCDEFGSLAEFIAYWNGLLSRLARGPIWMTPLDFRVEGVTCAYNPERTFASLRYKVRVFTRGSGGAGEPLAEFEAANAAVKGPDGQWYLNDGTLPTRKHQE